MVSLAKPPVQSLGDASAVTRLQRDRRARRACARSATFSRLPLPRSYSTHASVTHGDRFTGRHQAPCTFVQQRPHPVEFRCKIGRAAHVGQLSTNYNNLVPLFMNGALPRAAALPTCPSPRRQNRSAPARLPEQAARGRPERRERPNSVSRACFFPSLRDQESGHVELEQRVHG